MTQHPDKHIIQDKEGRIVGSYTIKPKHRTLSKKDYDYAQNLLVTVTKNFLIETEKQMATARNERPKETKDEKCNMVLLAGTIEKLDVRDKYGWMLLDCGSRSKVPVKAFDVKLLDLLAAFQTGDFIKIHATVSQGKVQESDRYEVLIVLASIRNEAPTRRESSSSAHGDGLPF